MKLSSIPRQKLSFLHVYIWDVFKNSIVSIEKQITKQANRTHKNNKKHRWKNFSFREALNFSLPCRTFQIFANQVIKWLRQWRNWVIRKYDITHQPISTLPPSNPIHQFCRSVKQVIQFPCLHRIRCPITLKILLMNNYHQMELKSMRGLAPRTSVASSLLNLNLRPCHRSELAIISANLEALPSKPSVKFPRSI